MGRIVRHAAGLAEGRLDTAMEKVQPAAEIFIYRDGGDRCYCNMRLASGERVLISLSAAGLLVTKLMFFGTIPTARIARLNPEDLAAMLIQLMPHNPTPDARPLKLVTGFCARSASIRDLQHNLLPFTKHR
jgi:hypothetical protein